jgi:hypothetical protein
LACYLTFGGMCCWRRFGVARVFALVMRCRVMRLVVNSRDGKNRDTRRETPAVAGAGRGASHKTFLFSYPIVAPRSANDIYRPVTSRPFYSKTMSLLWFNILNIN